MPDNFRFNFVADKGLREILDLAFIYQRQGAVGYAIRTTKPPEPIHEGEWGSSPVNTRLIFFWHVENGSDVIRLPVRADAALACEIVQKWLAEVDYGKQPDHDGDNKKGFNVYNEAWGHIDNDSYAFVAIRPMWTLYGK